MNAWKQLKFNSSIWRWPFLTISTVNYLNNQVPPPDWPCAWFTRRSVPTSCRDGCTQKGEGQSDESSGSTRWDCHFRRFCRVPAASWWCSPRDTATQVCSDLSSALHSFQAIHGEAQEGYQCSRLHFHQVHHRISRSLQCRTQQSTVSSEAASLSPTARPSTSTSAIPKTRASARLLMNEPVPNKNKNLSVCLFQ